ncbi:MAG: hypothetical protein IRZ10_06385 [Thermoflavifilum sp.]|nr:hypothetical protein [Thermoflavifilum sp.]MCL6514033.1 hypothetical protein [Alicyclobacillus sp.]
MSDQEALTNVLENLHQAYQEVAKAAALLPHTGSFALLTDTVREVFARLDALTEIASALLDAKQQPDV